MKAITPPAEQVGKTEVSRALFEEARKWSPLGVQGAARWFEPHPLYISRAEGARLHDVDGNEYVDFWAAAGPIILGHSYPALTDSIRETMETVGTLFCLPHPREVELAHRLCELVPSAEKVIYGCGGSDVLVFAIRAARTFTGRTKILKFEGAYHGWNDAVLFSVQPRIQEAGPREAPRPVAASSGMSTEAAKNILILPYNDVETVERVLAKRGRELAAIVVEPVFHTPGCILPRPGFLQILRQMADTYGIVLIFDEIITGIRHSLRGAQEHLGVAPDLTLLGKAIANGFPISALAGRNDIMSVFAPEGPAYYSGTYMGQVLNVAAALVTLKALEDGTVHEKIGRFGDTLAAEINNLAVRKSVPLRCQNYRSVWSVYFTDREVTEYRELMAIDFPRAPADVAFRKHLLSQGIYFHPATTRGYFYAAHSENDLDRALGAIESFVDSHASMLKGR